MRSWLWKRVEVPPRRWILLPIGFALKAREFHGNAILAFEAAERGWGVILGSKAVRYNDRLPRGMLIEKNIAPGTARKIATSLTLGQRLSACCEEGLVYNNAEEYGRRKIEKSSYDLLEMFFCWGRHHASDLVDRLGCNSNKIVISGNPRFDLHRAELRDVFAERASEITKKYGPFILINTKFSHYNGYYGPDATLAKMRSLGKVRNTEQETEALGQIAFHKTGFEKFMKLVEEVSRRFPEHTVVVRPHPSERHDPWKAKAATLPNVEVIFEGNVVEWILASEICIHNNCTTGVESYLLGRTSISYRPLSDPRFDLYLPNALSVEAFELCTVIDLVERALRGEHIATAQHATTQREIARQFIENVDGKRACTSFLDALGSLDLPEEPLTYSVGPISDFEVAARKKLQSIRRVLKGGRSGETIAQAWAKESAARKRTHALKTDDLSADDLRKFLGTAQRVTGRFHDVQVRKLEKDLLCVF
jgi:surface carbohydrate biosynthesis protein